MQHSSFFSQNSRLISKIIFTLLMLAVCRVGVYIPIPGIDSASFRELISHNQVGILGMFNMLSGGAFGNMSIFALAIMPYITASIIIQLLSMIYPALEKLKKEGEAGRQKINQITRYCTVILASLQALGTAAGLEHFTTDSMPIVIVPGLFFKATTVITLVVGTMFLMWIGEQISSRGIGNGSSLIIFVGIVSNIPSSVINIFELSRKGGVSPLASILVMLVIVALIAIIVFFEKAQRRVLVYYPKRQLGNKIYKGDSTHMPLKLNTAGVIPPIFASSLLLFPLTIFNLSQNKESWILEMIVSYFSPGKPVFVLCYGLFIVFFSIFYTAIVFNSEETAENLRKYNAYIPGIRPGKSTAEYFDYILGRVSILGALYLCFICIVPEVIMSKAHIATTLGGTSLLIVVNVVLDTLTQIQAYIFTNRYDVLLKRMKYKDRRM